MSFKRFDTEDIVVSSDSISSPAWTGNEPTLDFTQMQTRTAQTNLPSGDYYHNVYRVGTDDIQFSVAYGNRDGGGSADFNTQVPGYSPSKVVYGQFRTLINGDEDTDFQFGNSTPTNVLFISIERARFKEKLLPGSLTLVIGPDATTNITLTDNSIISPSDTFRDSGREYLIYSGSGGTVLDTTTVYGKLYPDIGVIALNGDLLAPTYIGFEDTGSNYTGNISNISSLVGTATTPGNILSFTLRAEETISSNYVFVRARNSEFNYSTNPSNITGSGELQHSTMIDSPQAYVTAVGLYNDNNDLLAVSKLSKPLLKDFTKEALIRIKLDY